MPFWQVTQDGLDYALEAEGLTDAGLRDTLLGLYKNLEAYPEVPAMLKALKGQGMTTAILSNGSMDMLDAAVSSAGIGEVLDAVISVEDVGVFKPDRRVYDLVGTKLGIEPAEVAFFSSNGWDATHASAYGFDATWVNRRGAPLDRVGAPPARQMDDLSGVPALFQ